MTVLAAGAALAAGACGGDAPPPVEAEVAGLAVAVYPDPARIVIADGDTVLFDGLPGGNVGEDDAPHVALATRTVEPAIDTNFGAWKFEEINPEGWNGVKRFEDVTISVEGSLEFGLIGDGGAIGTGTIASGGADGHVTLRFDFPDENRASIAFGCDATEHFLGFGGQAFDVDHRGETVPIWVEEDGIMKADHDDYYALPLPWFLHGRKHSTHTPMPMYVSSRGYALVLDTPYRSIFSMCSEAEEVVRVEAWEGALALHLFRGETPKQSIERMTGFVGRPRVPPRFAFAPWLDAIYGEENVARVAQKLRDEDIAVSVIWSEDWRGANDEDLGYVLEEDWTVDRDIYPDFEGLAASLHADGYKFLIYHNTFLDETAPEQAEALAGGYTIENSAGEPYIFQGVKFNDTTLLDLSNPDAVAWGKQKYKDSLLLGADGYMADFAEWLPHDAVLASGEDPMAAHNLYPLAWQKLNQELFDELEAEDGVERLYFVRSAYLRSQSLVSVVWAGDQQTDFTIDDGMPSVIPIGLGLGVTGFPYFGHDIAGYMNQFTVPVTKELFFRWVTLGAFSPVMRTHHGRAARENWNWESDAETTAHMRRWTRFHMQLFPYLWKHANDASATGLPIFAPLALAYPDHEAGWTATDQYMLGDRLIVAPIIEQGATSRSVELPSGSFYPLLGGAPVSGTITAEAGIGDIPVFVPAGTVLVLAPDTVDTVVDVAPDSTTVTFDDIGDDRELWVYPGGSSSFTEVGGLAYTWSADDAGGATGATFGGAPAEVADGDGFLEVTVTGPGTLTFDDGATLTLEGGDAARTVQVRYYQ